MIITPVRRHIVAASRMATRGDRQGPFRRSEARLGVGGVSLNVSNAFGDSGLLVGQARHSLMLADMLTVASQFAAEAPPRTELHPWLMAPGDTLGLLDSISTIERARRSNAQNLIVGIGGSIGVFRAIHNTLGAVRGRDVVILDQPDPDSYPLLGQAYDLELASLIACSTSGMTREISALVAALFKDGVRHSNTIIACAPRYSSPLADLLKRFHKEIVGLDISEDVDPRFGSFAPWLALMVQRAGHNTKALFEGALQGQKSIEALIKAFDKETIKKYLEHAGALDSLLLEAFRSETPDARLQKAIRTANAGLLGGYKNILDLAKVIPGISWGVLNACLGETAPTNIVVLMHPKLYGTSEFIRQMKNESMGKTGVDTNTVVLTYENAQRMMPALCKGNYHFTFITVSDSGDKSLDALRCKELSAMKDQVRTAQRASFDITLDRIDEHSMGSFMYNLLLMPVAAQFARGLRSRKQPDPYGAPAVVGGKVTHAGLIAQKLGRISDDRFLLDKLAAGFVAKTAGVTAFPADYFNNTDGRREAILKIVGGMKPEMKAAGVGEFSVLGGAKGVSTGRKSGGSSLIINPWKGHESLEVDNGVAFSTFNLLRAGRLCSTVGIFHGCNTGLLVSGQEKGEIHRTVRDFIFRPNGTWAPRIRGDEGVNNFVTKPYGTQFAVAGSVTDFPISTWRASSIMLERIDIKMRQRPSAFTTWYEMAINGGCGVDLAAYLEMLAIHDLSSSSGGQMLVWDKNLLRTSDNFFNGEIDMKSIFDPKPYPVVFGSRDPVDKFWQLVRGKQ